MQIAIQPVPKQTTEITSFVLLNLFADFGEHIKIPFVHQGHFEWKDAQLLIGGIDGDQSLVIRHPQYPMDVPATVCKLDDFKAFAKDHNIQLKNIDIDELISEMEIRGRVIAGIPPETYLPPMWMKRSVRLGYVREQLALMTLAIFLFGNTEFAFLFIFCICKYSDKKIRKDMKCIWDKTFQ